MTRRLALAALFFAASATAQSSVIEPGREREVLALFAPYELAQEVTPGWKLWNVRVGAQAIELELVGPAGEVSLLRLTEAGDAAERSASFAIQRPQGNTAVDGLVAALRKNDGGGFWHARVVTAEPPAPTDSAGFAWPVGVAVISAALMWWLAARK